MSLAISDSSLYSQVIDWSNLLLAFRLAAKGKRGKPSAAGFEHQVADRLVELQRELTDFSYRPGGYVNFIIHEPKQRLVSAAPFRDRVVHHALCNVIEPIFERQFIADSYANRAGKGTHAAIDRLQALSRKHRYVLRMDIVKHFPSLDHAVMIENLRQTIRNEDVMRLIERIIASGAGVLSDEYEMVYFPGDDLFAVNRPRGLPIGNLTSQFWSNVYLTPLDLFVTQSLNCPAYLRYVDDFALFSDSKRQLYEWKQAIIRFLYTLRLTIHEAPAQVIPCAHGIPWLGFVVYPTHRRIKARNVVKFSRKLKDRWSEYCAGTITFAEFDASVKGWVNHVRYADTWGLRTHVLGQGLVYRKPDF
ncbi:MAG: RNA-dependent DNA polymerase [Acidobacteria bacterium]|nr:RNA-dependent DNA polymerase [Acidobacteriota bacterium]